MRRIIVIVAVVIALFALTGTAPVLGQENAVFEATFNQASLVSASCNEAAVCEFVFEGSGAVNIMGPVSWTVHVTQDFTTTPCSTIFAESTLVGATGTINLTDNAVACPSDSPTGEPFIISGVWEITGGSGEFSEIAGSGTSQGVIAGQGPVVHFSGTVSY